MRDIKRRVADLEEVRQPPRLHCVPIFRDETEAGALVQFGIEPKKDDSVIFITQYIARSGGC
jgi:hypothetical protein